jgi:hypothetical protein
VIEDAEVAKASHDKIQSEILEWQIEKVMEPHLRLRPIEDQCPMIPFFTDGSGYQGLVGAAAATPEADIYLRIHLGTTEDSTVYVAELNGIEMAFARFLQWKSQSAELEQSSRQEGQSSRQSSRQSTGLEPSQVQGPCPIKTVIFSDSQAAIQAIANPKRSSGQYVIDLIYQHVRALRSLTPTSSSIPAKVQWIPAHVGVPGIDLAKRGFGLGFQFPYPPTGLLTKTQPGPWAGFSRAGLGSGRVLARPSLA